GYARAVSSKAKKRRVGRCRPGSGPGDARRPEGEKPQGHDAKEAEPSSVDHNQATFRRARGSKLGSEKTGPFLGQINSSTASAHAESFQQTQEADDTIASETFVMATDSYPAKRKPNRLPWVGFLLT